MSLTRLSWVCIKHFAKGRAVVSYPLPGGSQQDDPKSRYALHGLRLALAYVLLASSFYDDYQFVALALGGARDLKNSGVRPKHIIALGEACGLRAPAILSTVEDLGKRLGTAKEVVRESNVGPLHRRESLIENMEKRWNGTFASTGSFMSKRHAKDGKPKD